MVASKNLRGLAEMRDRIKSDAQALRAQDDTRPSPPSSNDAPWSATEGGKDGHS